MASNKITMQNEIDKLLEGLERLNRLELRNHIKKSHKLSVLEYSKSIYQYQPKNSIEYYLKEAFKKELVRLEYESSQIEKILGSLEKHRVIQTGPHLVPCSGPRMLCLDWQASVGVSNNEYYLVGVYTGIPFSNIFYPGHLTFNSEIDLAQIIPKDTLLHKEIQKNHKIKEDSFGLKEKKISLIPSRIQNELVFRSKMTDKTREVVNTLTPSLQTYFNLPSLNQESYSKWALQSNQKIVSKVLKKENIVYLDINEVISNYLVEVFAQPEHFVYKLFFDTPTRERFTHFFETDNLFLIPYASDKFLSQEGMSIKGEMLVSKHTTFELKPEILIDALKNKRLCPGLILTFTILAFLNGFKCLGSFRQVVYLSEYKEKWIQSGLLDNTFLEEVPVCTVTTGFFSDSHQNSIRPIDIILGKEYTPDPTMLFEELLFSVKDKFLQ